MYHVLRLRWRLENYGEIRQYRTANNSSLEEAADMSLPDDIPRRGTALGRPPVSLFALAWTGYGPLRRRILGVVVTKDEQK